jgi:hypothetical protein
MAPDAPQQRNPLPFEPSKKRQKSVKHTTKASESAQDLPPQKSKKADKSTGATTKIDRTPLNKEEMVVPKVVSNRMARRMALFCGIPTALGMATFIASYIIKSYTLFKLPNVVVLLVSIGFFGLGILGLSYGVLSASWDEERIGSKLGGQEFRTNWGRMMSAWRSTRQKNV